MRRSVLWLLPLIGTCYGAQSALEPAGPAASRIAYWWWVMFILAVLVFAVVLVLLLLSLLRRRGDPTPDTAPPKTAWVRLVWIAGAIVPAVVLAILLGLNIRSEVLVAVAAKAPQLEIQVIGHRWWWEVYYPAQGFATANEIHIPAETPVKLLLTSQDVIHSFWVPQLEGKRDLIPGQTTELTLQADKEGIYRGQCAEYCGLQHALMALVVRAEAPERFQAWVSQQQKAAPTPEANTLAFEGQQVFQGSACVYCHTVRGTNASSRFGPDLTHLASRSYIGAGIRANTPANLQGWIVNSQAIKPGNKMPPMYLSVPELRALMAYLGTLK